MERWGLTREVECLRQFRVVLDSSSGLLEPAENLPTLPMGIAKFHLDLAEQRSVAGTANDEHDVIVEFGEFTLVVVA